MSASPIENMAEKSKRAPIPYSEALHNIETEASRLLLSTSIEEFVPLTISLNRISNRKYVSPESTPKFDTSAMDGYALNSKATAAASPDAPVRFRVLGTIAAGDAPFEVNGDPDGEMYPCVEIMTGARFPISTKGKEIDCCVKVEDTRIESGGKIIQVLRPAKRNMNRRFAGNDFKKGDKIIEAGERIKINHLMALASIGVEEVAVRRKPRIAVFSTGKELLYKDEESNAQRVTDINGPCITAALTDEGYDVDFCGIIDDNSSALSGRITHQLQLRQYDLLITTGGVSVGKFDFVRKSIESIGGKVLFHGAAIRPGHPALFATVPTTLYHDTNDQGNGSYTRKNAAFFGLPGNPVASAACLRFLVVPFLQHFLSEPSRRPVKAAIRDETSSMNGKMAANITEGDIIATFPPDKDIFRAGRFAQRQHNKFDVEIIHDHSPGKIKPFLDADCWIHIPRGHVDLRDGDLFDVYPISERQVHSPFFDSVTVQ